MNSVVYPKSFDIQLFTFSFLDGDDLFHKICRLNKKVRDAIPGAGLLDQRKTITIKIDKN